MIGTRVARTAFKRAALVAACALVVLTGSASAQVWGVWSNPAPVESGRYTVSGHFLAGDVVGIMGHLRTGLGERLDLGVQVGIPDFDFDFAVAGDARYLVAPSSESLPVDIAVDGAFGYTKFGGESSGSTSVSAKGLHFDVGGIVSIAPVEMSNGMALAPYGALAIAILRRSVDVSGSNLPQSVRDRFDTSATDTDVHFRAGVQLDVQENLGINGELNLGSREIFVTFGAAMAL